MTLCEWQTATEPTRMIDWLEEQSYVDALWDFTVACCRRTLPELPGDVFHASLNMSRL